MAISVHANPSIEKDTCQHIIKQTVYLKPRSRMERYTISTENNNQQVNMKKETSQSPNAKTKSDLIS